MLLVKMWICRFLYWLVLLLGWIGMLHIIKSILFHRHAYFSAYFHLRLLVL